MQKGITTRKKTVLLENKSAEDCLLRQSKRQRGIEKRQREQANRKNRRDMVRILNAILKEKEIKTCNKTATVAVQENETKELISYVEDDGFRNEGMKELASLLDKKPVGKRNGSHPSAGAEIARRMIMREDATKAVNRFKQHLLKGVDVASFPQDRAGKTAYACARKPPPHKRVYDPQKNIYL